MLTRIISGIIGIGIAAFVIQTGGLIFALFCLMLMLVGYHEYVKAFKNIDMGLSLYGAMAALVFIWYGTYSIGICGLIGTATFAVLAVLSLAVLRYGKLNVAETLTSAAGVCYLGLTLPCLMLIRFSCGAKVVESPFGTMELGCALVWLTFVGTWASDTFAYFAGCAFGRHKLCSNVSPKKTIEGFIGGLIGTAASVAALGSAFGFDPAPLAILGVLQSLVAALGDLVESIIKRYTGIKDSGNLIPGHGGVLDRFDSVIFTAPTVYYFLFFLFGI